MYIFKYIFLSVSLWNSGINYKCIVYRKYSQFCCIFKSSVVVKKQAEGELNRKITPGCRPSATSLQSQSASYLNKKNYGSPSLMVELHFQLSWLITKEPKQHSVYLNWTSVGFYLKPGFVL